MFVYHPGIFGEVSNALTHFYRLNKKFLELFQCLKDTIYNSVKNIECPGMNTLGENVQLLFIKTQNMVEGNERRAE